MTQCNIAFVKCPTQALGTTRLIQLGAIMSNFMLTSPLCAERVFVYGRVNNKLKLLAGSSALALSLSIIPSAFAQSTSTGQSTTPQTVVAQNAPDQQASAPGAETVVVPASRISIAGYQEPTPVSVLDPGQLQQAANSDIGQT